MRYRATQDVWISQIPVLLKKGEMFEYPQEINNKYLENLDRPAPVPEPAKAPPKPKAKAKAKPKEVAKKVQKAPPKKKAAPK